MFPKKIKTLENKYIIMASCGNKYSCALTNQGHIYSWGRGNYKDSNTFTQPEFFVLFTKTPLFLIVHRTILLRRDLVHLGLKRNELSKWRQPLLRLHVGSAIMRRLIGMESYTHGGTGKDFLTFLYVYLIYKGTRVDRTPEEQELSSAVVHSMP